MGYGRPFKGHSALLCEKLVLIGPYAITQRLHLHGIYHPCDHGQFVASGHSSLPARYAAAYTEHPALAGKLVMLARFPAPSREADKKPPVITLSQHRHLSARSAMFLRA